MHFGYSDTDVADKVAVGIGAMAAYNAVVYAAATYGTGSAAKRVNVECFLENIYVCCLPVNFEVVVNE